MLRKLAVPSVLLLLAPPLASAQSLFFPARNDFDAGIDAIDVAAADFDGDGLMDGVTVGELGIQQATQQEAIHVFFGDGRGLFFAAAPLLVPLGSRPGKVVVGQFNNDNSPDIAVAVQDVDGSAGAGTVGGALVFLNDGTGGFPTPAKVLTAGGVQDDIVGLAVGAITGDAIDDLVVLNSSADSFNVFLGTADGNFDSSLPPTGTCDRPAAAAIGLLDAAPGNDLAIACDPASGTNANGVVRIYTGSGAGAFVQIGAEFAPSTLRDPRAVVIADLNNDNSGGLKNDLAIANSQLDAALFPEQGSLTVLRGTGLGGFTEDVPSFIGGFNPVSIVAGDVNGDGVLDLLLANFGSEDISVMKGSISGTGLNARSNYVETFFAAGFRVGGAVFADLDGRGNLDVLAANGDGFYGTLSSYIGGGSDLVNRALRMSMPRTTSNQPLNPNAMAAGDINGDGITDFVVANLDEGSVGIFRSTGPNAYANSKISPFDGPFDIALANFDGDGDLDLAVLTAPLDDLLGVVPGELAIFRNNGAGTFTEAADSPHGVGGHPFAMAIADLTGEGRLDIAVTNEADNTVQVFSGGANAAFSALTTFSTINGGDCSDPDFPDVDCLPEGIAAGDIDSDGDRDLAVVNLGDTAGVQGGTIEVFKNNGSGTFTHFQELSSLADPGDPLSDGIEYQVLRMTDLDGVNGPDIFAVAVFPDDLVSVFLNTADGTGTMAQAPFSPFLLPAMDRATLFAPRNTLVEDLNGDGTLDFAITGVNSNNVVVGLGNGDGSFFVPRADAFGTTQAPTAVAAGDTNEDGLTDLLVTGAGADDVALLLSGLGKRSDMDGSGRVDGFDLALLGRLFGIDFTDPAYDFYLDVNFDGILDGVDLAILAVAFGGSF